MAGRRSPVLGHGDVVGGGSTGGGGGRHIKANPAVARYTAKTRQTAARRLANAKRNLKLEKRSPKSGWVPDETGIRRAQAKVDKLEAQMKTPAKGKSKGKPATVKARGKALADKKAKKVLKKKAREGGGYGGVSKPRPAPSASGKRPLASVDPKLNTMKVKLGKRSNRADELVKISPKRK